MTEHRTVIPDKRKVRNLVQYRDLTDDEFEEKYSMMAQNVSPSAEFEKRIEKKLAEFENDYDLNDLKINDRDTLRALVQAQTSLEDYEQVMYKMRESKVSIDNIVVIDKVQKIMADLRKGISELQNDLKITRKVRKSDQEASVISFIDNLKIKAKKFSEAKMSYIFCDKCHLLLATVWCIYPESSKNKLRFVCNRPTEGGGTCGNIMDVGTKELFENKGTNNTSIMPEGMI